MSTFKQRAAGLVGLSLTAAALSAFGGGAAPVALADAHAPGQTWTNSQGQTCHRVDQGLAPIQGYRTGRLPMGYTVCVNP